MQQQYAIGIATDGLARQASRRVQNPLPRPVIWLAITVFLPIGMSFFVGGFRLTPLRLLLILVSPYLAVMYRKKFVEGSYRFVYSDFFIVVYAIWGIIAPANIDGIVPALNHAGPVLMEFCCAYFVPRLLLKRHGDALRLVRMLCIAISIAASVGIMDSFAGYYVTHRTVGMLTGYAQNYLSTWTSDAYRMGIFRATGPLEHPILYGFVCAVALLLALTLPMKGRRYMIPACSLGLFFSVSAGPMMCFFFGFVLFLYGKIMARFRWRWIVLIGSVIAAIVATFTLTNSPIGYIISHLTFDPYSGYYRFWTWTQVTYYMSFTPWYGFGYEKAPEAISHSIDSLWLVLSLNNGYPGAVLVALAFLGSMSRNTGAKLSSLLPDERRLAMMLSIIIVLMFYIGFLVDLWGSTWIFAGIILGIRAHLGELSVLGNVRARPKLRFRQQRLVAPIENPDVST